MYPSGELEQLAHRKSLLRARIAVRRWESASTVRDLVRPLAHIDRGILLWRQFAPYLKLLAIPAGVAFARLLRGRPARKRDRKKGKIALLLSALPLIIRAVKLAVAMRAAYAKHLAAALRRTPPARPQLMAPRS